MLRLPVFATDVLACPTCHAPFEVTDRVLHCERGHSFDLSRDASVSLLNGRLRHPGDDDAMVRNRAEWLDTGAFDPIHGRVVEHVAALGSRRVVDLGGGTGHLLRAISARLPALELVLCDASKPALAAARRRVPESLRIRADLHERLPIRDASVGLALSMFAPRPVDELARVLGPGGHAVVVTPSPRHLLELRTVLGLLKVDPEKDERLRRRMGGAFERVAEESLQYVRMVSPREARLVVEMGPNAFHQDPIALREALRGWPPAVAVTCAFHVSVWRRC